MTADADACGEAIVAPAEDLVESMEEPEAEQDLPEVMGWELPPMDAKMEREIAATLAQVHAETAAAIAAEDAEVHETCPTCNHTKTFMNVVNTAGKVDLVPKAVEPVSGSGWKGMSCRRPIGFKPAKKTKK
jgi:cell pole-organizing protein PopZ